MVASVLLAYARATSMHSSENPPTVEAFLLIEQPRQRLGHWTKALAGLDGPTAPPTVSITAYYDPTSDQALLQLQYDPATANMPFVVEIAVLAEVGMVQPAELSEGERARFLADRLTRCTIRVANQRSASSALTELARKIKDIRANKVSPSSPPPIPAAALARASSTTAPRGDTADPVMLVNAKGTRDQIERYPERAGAPLGTGPEPPPPPRAGTVMQTQPNPVLDTQPNPLVDEDRHRTVPIPDELARKLIGESSQMMRLDMLKPPPASSGRGSEPYLEYSAPKPSRQNTPTTRMRAEVDPRNKTPAPELMTPAPSSGVPQPAPRIRTEQYTEVYMPANTTPQLPSVIHARYMRGGRWVPVRVGALSLKGAVLLAGALPRSDDRVDITFSFGTYRASVRGIVGKVSSNREATQTGVATFSVSFELDDSGKRQLTQLLMAARDAKITIKPPPPRATRRFPVEWKVALGTMRGAVKAIALDVSTHGMFVQPAVALEVDTTLTFSVLLDDGSAPIAGRARVVRQVKDADAKAAGLLAGFGLLIVSMSEADMMRWYGFLARIERRAEKRVLIGAEPARLAELAAGLASLGYAVTGGTDPGALVELVNTDARPADAVLIDAGWLKSEANAALIENSLSSRNLPCVTMQGEVRRARLAIDKLLEVVV